MEWKVIDDHVAQTAGEVLIANFREGSYGYKDKIIGRIGYIASGRYSAENEYEQLQYATHYVDIYQYDIPSENNDTFSLNIIDGDWMPVGDIEHSLGYIWISYQANKYWWGMCDQVDITSHEEITEQLYHELRKYRNKDREHFLK
jgi:hypothetical protein